MSVDLEPAGALATAGLVANELEGDKGKPHGEHASGNCANCNARLSGPYCHECGQTAHVHRSLFHIVEEVLHGVLHFDTKSWRTLPLLIGRPGLLTRRYIEGQRARYVSPMALFLFCVFLMFFVFSLIKDSKTNSVLSGPENIAAAREELAKEIANAKEEVAKREAALAKATSDEDREEAQDNLKEAQDDLHGAETGLAAVDLIPLKPEAKNAPAANAPTANPSTTATPAAEPSTSDIAKSALAKVNIKTGYPPFDRVLQHASANPELTLYKLKNAAYKFSFMLVPISLPFLWLMFFWRRGVRMYDHAIFSLYSLSFMSLLFTLIALSSMSNATKGLVGLAVFVPPVHMYLHLKETYRLGWFAAWWRTWALLFIAGLVFTIFLVMILAISLS
jgi:hypothetical protein